MATKSQDSSQDIKSRNTKSNFRIRDRIEAEVLNESINFYRRWRQQAQNGILPIGIAAVGKTTLLYKFEVAGPNLFMDFNRTLATKVDSHLLGRYCVR
jgi:hypothetical protein